MDSNFLCLSLSAMKQLFLPKPWSLFYWCLMYKQRHNYWCLYITILMTFLFISFAQKLLKALNNKVLMSVLAYVIYFDLIFLLFCFLYITINLSLLNVAPSFWASFLYLVLLDLKSTPTTPKKTHSVLVTNIDRDRFIFDYTALSCTMLLYTFRYIVFFKWPSGILES